MKVFLVCLLACVITTAIGVLILSLVYVNNPPLVRDANARDDGASSTNPEEKSVDVKFQFLNHLGKSKVKASILCVLLKSEYEILRNKTREIKS